MGIPQDGRQDRFEGDHSGLGGGIAITQGPGKEIQFTEGSVLDEGQHHLLQDGARYCVSCAQDNPGRDGMRW